MPAIALLAPVVLPLLAAGVTTGFGLAGFNFWLVDHLQRPMTLLPHSTGLRGA